MRSGWRRSRLLKRTVREGMTTITIELPDELAQEAKSHGLFQAAAVELMIRETLRRRAGRELLEAADTLAAAKFPPMTMAEIQEEVDAVRSERRRRSPA